MAYDTMCFYIPKIINDQDEAYVHVRSQKILKLSQLAPLVTLSCCRTDVVISMAFIIHLCFYLFEDRPENFEAGLVPFYS